MRYLGSSTSFFVGRSRRTSKLRHGSTALSRHTGPCSTPSRFATERARSSFDADGSDRYVTGRPASRITPSDAARTCAVNAADHSPKSFSSTRDAHR